MIKAIRQLLTQSFTSIQYLFRSFVEKDMEVNVKLDRGVKLPFYATDGAAGFDLKAHSFKKLFSGDREIDLNQVMETAQREGYIKLRPGERILVGTGVYMEIPKGYVLDLRARSGLAVKKGLCLANGVGTIDSDYRGELMIALLNTTKFLSKVTLGERIAQGVILPCVQAKFITVDKLSETERNTGGFGSTGK